MRYWKRVFLVVATVVALLAATLPPASGHSRSVYCGHAGESEFPPSIDVAYEVVGFMGHLQNYPAHEHRYRHDPVMFDRWTGKLYAGFSHYTSQHCGRH